jgi:hypothetical protein
VREAEYYTSPPQQPRDIRYQQHHYIFWKSIYTLTTHCNVPTKQQKSKGNARHQIFFLFSFVRHIFWTDPAFCDTFKYCQPRYLLMDIIAILLVILYVLLAVLFFIVIQMYRFCHAISPRIEKFDNGISTVSQFLDKMQSIVLIQEEEIIQLTEQVSEINRSRNQSLNQSMTKEEPELWMSS